MTIGYSATSNANPQFYQEESDPVECQSCGCESPFSRVIFGSASGLAIGFDVQNNNQAYDREECLFASCCQCWDAYCRECLESMRVDPWDMMPECSLCWTQWCSTCKPVFNEFGECPECVAFLVK